MYTVAWVLPSHYYKIVGTSITLDTSTEYVFTKGSLSDSGNLSGSRSLGSVYQNTSGVTRFVGIEVGTSGSATALSDAATTPTTSVMAAGIGSGVGVTLMFPVLNNHYYEVTGAGGASITKWYEWDLTGVTVTRSPSLAARSIENAATPTRGFWNVSGKSLMAFYSGHNNATNTAIIRADPIIGFSAQSVSVAVVSVFSSNSGVIRPVYVAVNPSEFYTLYMDAGTGTTDTYFEFTLE
jgi:hypothetical protein